MGFKDIFVRCSRGHSSSSCCYYYSSYQKLHYQTADMTVMQGKQRQRTSGGAISCIEKPSMWRHFSSALVLRRVLDDYGAGVGPVIIFSSPWGLPVLSHPALVPRKKIGSSYRKAVLWVVRCNFWVHFEVALTKLLVMYFSLDVQLLLHFLPLSFCTLDSYVSMLNLQLFWHLLSLQSHKNSHSMALLFLVE